MTKKMKLARIDELQALSWEITKIPEHLRRVWALKLPNHWRHAIRGLDPVDRVGPVGSLYLTLQALAPEIICFLPGAFSRNPDRQPDYWFLTETSPAPLDSERLLWAVTTWLNECYGSTVVRSIAAEFKHSDLEWEQVDLQEAPPETTAQALPGLTARWLVSAGYQFRLSDSEGHLAEWPMRLAPSRGQGAELVSWPPIAPLEREGSPLYSYYLHFHTGSSHRSNSSYLLCRPGIRRWATQPLAKPRRDSKGTYVDLAWAREKSIYMARQSASWLSGRPAETSLLRLGLRRYHGVKWSGMLANVLNCLTPHEDIPEPLLLLSKPTAYQPETLIVHDNTLSERHLVGLGIEAADRWEVFQQLDAVLPPGFDAEATWRQVGGYIRARPSFAAKIRTQIEPAARQNGAAKLEAPARIEICSPDADVWQRILLEVLGLPERSFSDGEVKVVSPVDGSVTILHLEQCAIPADLLAELPAGAEKTSESQYGAERARARAITRRLAKTTENAGVLVEMPNYRELHHRNSRQAARDPKRAVRTGLAQSGRVSQFARPRSSSPDDYEMRLRSAARDLLRQMDLHWNPVYTGFKKTSLPEEVDIVGLWQIRLNPRRRGERKVTLPLVVHAPAGAYRFQVCLPGDDGPRWLHYREALLTVPGFAGGYENRGAIRAFFQRALSQLASNRPILLLLCEQKLRDVLPELTDHNIAAGDSGLTSVLPIDGTTRVARLRFSSDGDVPLVCPTRNFGRYTGLFAHGILPRLFYSIQVRPVTAQRRRKLRQRDAWRKQSWNPSTVEITMLRLCENDVADEWAWIVHRLRQESSHTDLATLLPEPLHSASKIAEYVLRLPNGDTS